MNKKGAEMTIGTIIVIILALVVLVVIIYGFVTGWGNLWQKIIGIGGGGKPNVQTQVDSCKIACASDAKSDYCKTRNVIFEDNSNQTLTCEQLASQRGTSVGLDSCPGISCVNQNLPGKACLTGWPHSLWTDKTCFDLGGSTYVQVNPDLILETDKNDPANGGKICCLPRFPCPTTNSWYPKTTGCSSQLYDVTSLITLDDQTAHAGKVCCVA